ncbi:MAG: HAMP domain-containing sensor histidine kinase [Actinomycetota bacterium]
MPSSVRARITFAATAIVAVTLILASWMILAMVERDLVDATERALAAELELELESADFFGGEEFIFFEFAADGRDFGLGMFTIAEEGIAFGEIFEQGFVVGEVFIDTNSLNVIDIIDPKTGLPLADPELVQELSEAAFEAVEITEHEAGEAAEGQALLVGAAARDEVDDSLEAVQDALTLIVPALVLLMGGFIWFLVGRALRPVGAMSERVEAISTTSLDQRVPVPAGRDEINNLATVMNGMLDRLQRGDRRQRQFAADASHELRSPLSTVRAAAEMIETKPAGGRTEQLAGDIVAEADRMDRLIGDLLHLSRVDEDRAGDSFEVVDLGIVAAEAAAGAEVQLGSELAVTGSPDRLRRVVENLVANAHRHARDRVIVGVDRVEGSVQLRVEDDGAGVALEDRERIFERFSRLDEARSRDQGGAGLGLALVQAIVTRHGGTIQVGESTNLGGASFVATFPAAM